MTEDRVHYLDREFLYFEETQTWDQVEPGTDTLVEVPSDVALRRDRIVESIQGYPDGAPDLVDRLVLDEGTGQFVGEEEGEEGREEKAQPEQATPTSVKYKLIHSPTIVRYRQA
jgi:hypothetical protein